MTAMDYAALPPEVNSGRMYAGAGAGPMLATAAAWDQLAGELCSAADSYQAVISELTEDSWQGPASASMAAAAMPYATWMTATAAQVQQAASQARAAAAAYQAAYSAMVPPQAITANRAVLTKLLATNTFGQNAPAIAANQAQYGQMWAQDTAAMYSYAAASAAATTLAPFSEAPQTTNPAGAANQAAASNQAITTGGLAQASSQIPNVLQGIASGASVDPSQWLLDLLNSTPIQGFEGLMAGSSGLQSLFLGSFGFFASGILFMLSPGENIAVMAAMAAAAPAALVSDVSGAAEGALLAGSAESLAGSAGLGGAQASASLARAASVGGLSVPQSWGSAAPAIRLASGAAALPIAGAEGLSAAAPGGMFGAPMGPIGSVVNAPRNGERSRYGSRAKLLPGMAAESTGHDGTPGHWANFDGLTPEPGPASERDQLNGLRKAVTAMSKERDVLKRSATLLIKEAMHK